VFKKTREIGFTLIELLIVITIIGILAVIFIPTVLNAPAKARDVRRMADVTRIVKAITAAELDGVSLPSPANLCIDSSNFAAFKVYFEGGIIPSDPDSTNGVDGSSNNDCLTTNLGKYMVRIYTTAQQISSGGFKYGVFANTELTSNSNMNCLHIGASSGLYDPIGGSPKSCYGVKTQ